MFAWKSRAGVSILCTGRATVGSLLAAVGTGFLIGLGDLGAV